VRTVAIESVNERAWRETDGMRARTTANALGLTWPPPASDAGGVLILPFEGQCLIEGTVLLNDGTLIKEWDLLAAV
jgi:hypothetical protein